MPYSDETPPYYWVEDYDPCDEITVDQARAVTKDQLLDRYRPLSTKILKRTPR